MAYGKPTLRRIYDRTTGYCHLCGKKLALRNYALPGRKGAWEVEHSRAVANGGSDDLKNLYAACIRCNRKKGVCTTRTARSWNDRTRAPFSRSAREKATIRNAILFGAAGLYFVGPLAGVAGVVLAAFVNPDKLSI